tara:strand:+ start:25733 stop:27652 length:1920 start_codon:yes stop_codon:yes gene_type:complete
MQKKFKKFLLSASRRFKKVIVLVTDFLAASLSITFVLIVSDEKFVVFQMFDQFRIILIPFLTIFAFWHSQIYSSVIRFIDTSLVLILFRAVSYSVILIFFLNSMLIFLWSYLYSLPFSYSLEIKDWIVGIITFSFIITSTRLFANYFLSERKSEKKVIIYGAGSAGIQLASALRVSSEMQPIAFLDSDTSLHGSYLGGMKVMPPNSLEKYVHKGKVDEVLIAMPSASKSSLRALLREIENYSVKVRILPGLAELAQGKVSVSELKEVDILDLLGREEVEANVDLLKSNIEDKVVLISGAGGSIGSELSRQVIKNRPRKIILLDANEYALYSIKNEISNSLTKIEVYSVLANVTNKKRMIDVCSTFGVDTIYHAAAYKHVPLVEENPFEAVFNNIFGTKICAEAAQESNVETFVLISTDKAVRPTNIMGATKRFAELILQSMAQDSKTRMTMVRFGNVIGSSGSAIPLFQRQIKEGGPVTVTHPEVIRYFMSIPEAAELVIQAGAMGKGGDVFVLDMGEPVKIYELAKRLIKLSGMEIKEKDNPDGDIEIIFTGLRAGEKLYEELLIGDNASPTDHRQILRAEEDFISRNDLHKNLVLLKEAESEGNVSDLKDILKKVVSGFTPEDAIVDVVYQQKNNID